MLWSFSLFTYFSSFLCLSIASVTCLRLVVLKDADVGCTFSLFSIPFLPSSSLQVPCCFSCIVRLQVVWEQDLWEHMRVSETPQLTWLLRIGDKKKRNRGRWRPKWCREKCNAFFPFSVLKTTPKLKKPNNCSLFLHGFIHIWFGYMKYCKEYELVNLIFIDLWLNLKLLKIWNLPRQTHTPLICSKTTVVCLQMFGCWASFFDEVIFSRKNKSRPAVYLFICSLNPCSTGEITV